MCFLKSLRNKLVKNTQDDSCLITKAASDLATSTTLSALSLDCNNSYRLLCSSRAAQLDTILFSCFVLRVLCITSTKKRYKAIQFSEEYIRSVIAWSQGMFDDCFNSDIAISRFALYDRSFSKHNNIEKSMSALLEDFECIIKNDIIHRNFAPFSEASPLPVLDFADDLQCHLETNAYIKTLLDNVKHSLEDARNALR